MDLTSLKHRVAEDVRSRADVLLDVSHQIHERPELNFEERHAHDVLCAALDVGGLDVEPHAYGLDTAFAARAGDGDGPLVAVICEYDALPEIGHACGHNIIAAAGLGAGLAAAALAEELGGRIVVLGTPAEEGGGGKVLMGRQGAFDDVAAAMMIHPADADLTAMDTIAIHQLEVSYDGREAHAAAHPELGLNALDAAVLGYVNVAALRQHIGPDERIHGIITDGGAKPNIVPAHAAAHWYVRSPSLATLEPLKERVSACLSAGAAAAGCTMHAHWNDPPYADMLDNDPVVEAFRANAAQVGRDHRRPDPRARVVGSTDMGNVSYLTPSIHPMIRVAPPGVSIHTAAFTRHAAGAEGDAAVIDGAIAMAATVLDLWADEDLRRRAADDLRRATEGDHPPVL
ncbi:M20 family metallopeptidase [Actinomarinicola tropica]|uniref:Peptidase M20 domain-containing protein 2 n=1 Tax=Actinomarinicola tropica TaxID=2789776 RepID=A0A5Q2RK31_9ACTN|nr:M20 family metallopeptidase [Actinomarinicola tropica]QGG95282.1 amidohydrolase [Actinomarinicola tropica]